MKPEDEAELERRIRDRAYHLWLEEGRPEGRESEHWERARQLIAIEDNPHAGTLPNPMRDGAEVADRGEPVEPIEAVENQGEFPVLADQGEESTPPQRHPSGTRRSRIPQRG